MARTAIYQALEFKNYRIGSEEMDRLVGAALRARFKVRPATLFDVILFCRGYTPQAEAAALTLSAELNLRISFKVVP